MSETPSPSAAAWDARYRGATGGLFGDAPNAWLAMALARPGLGARSLLALADGDGRNGTWAAAQGLSVTGLDHSAEATRRAEARDREAGVRVERICADLAHWSPDARRWDLAALIYLQGPEALRRRAVELSVEALSPGGCLVLEGFAKAQATGAMGPEDPAKLWSLEEIAAWAPGLSATEMLEGSVTLDEGPRHSGTARVVRVLAQAPCPG